MKCIRKDVVLKNENIDGFRCDVASNVPLDFWQQAIPQLRKEKNKSDKEQICICQYHNIITQKTWIQH
jgi:glycosidase